MEVFNVISNKDDKIVLSSEKQIETLLNEIEKGQAVMIRWYEGGDKKSKLLMTDGLMSKVKDGRFIIEAEEAEKA